MNKGVTTFVRDRRRKGISNKNDNKIVDDDDDTMEFHHQR